jgi:hypothetical protein
MRIVGLKMNFVGIKLQFVGHKSDILSDTSKKKMLSELQYQQKNFQFEIFQKQLNFHKEKCPRKLSRI